MTARPVGIELPQTVELTVVETEPGLKSATASSVTKPAKTETGTGGAGAAFINEGEKIRVDTAEGAIYRGLSQRTAIATFLMIARRYIVRGRVQGVGFRWFVDHEARSLGLAGWVRNNIDGTVEALAMGSNEQHTAFAAKLRQGPSAARVDEVTELPAEPVDGLTTFRIEGAW